MSRRSVIQVCLETATLAFSLNQRSVSYKCSLDRSRMFGRRDVWAQALVRANSLA